MAQTKQYPFRILLLYGYGRVAYALIGRHSWTLFPSECRTSRLANYLKTSVDLCLFPLLSGGTLGVAPRRLSTGPFVISELELIGDNSL